MSIRVILFFIICIFAIYVSAAIETNEQGVLILDDEFVISLFVFY